MIAFEWDENKRLSNLAKHGLDFVDAVVVFSDQHLIAAARTVDGEESAIYVRQCWTMSA